MTGSGIFFLLLTQPMYNLLIVCYHALSAIGIADLGWAIIALTVVVKLVLMPFTAKSIKAQKAMQALQPHLDEIKEKYKDKKEEQAKAMMAVYKEHNINPASSCLPLLIQMPILIALYNVLRRSVNDSESLAMLYTFIPAPEVINHIFLGIIDLGVRSIPLAIIAGIIQYVQAKMLEAKRPPSSLGKKEGAKDESMAAAMTKSMTYTMPIVTVIFGASLPGGVMLYWLVSNLVSVLQQFVLFRTPKETPAA
ncbi:MAG: YidC/Oxa1 family membrane protein insertase [Patescibacteria group bacterium]